MENCFLGFFDQHFHPQNVSNVGLSCASLAPIYRDSTRALNDEVYCGWSDSPCVWRDGREVPLGFTTNIGEGSAQQFPGLIVDWSGTDQ